MKPELLTEDVYELRIMSSTQRNRAVTAERTIKQLRAMVGRGVWECVSCGAISPTRFGPSRTRITRCLNCGEKK